MKLQFNNEAQTRPLLHYVVRVFLISNAFFVVLFLSVYFFLASEINENTFESLVQQTLKTIEPNAAIAAFSSSDAMAALALKPVERLPWVKRTVLKDSFGDVLYDFNNLDSGKNNLNIGNELSYDLSVKGEVAGELLVVVDFSQSQNLVIDLLIGTLSIVFSTTLVSLFIYIFIKRKIVLPVKKLAQFVDEPQMATTNLHKSSPGFEKTLEAFEISELMSISRQLEKTVTQLSEQATIDPLTGLANRRAFDIDMEVTLKAGAACTLLLLDIDYFKFINDQYGHSAGDQTLRDFAHHLRVLAQSGNGEAYRLGGDEFAIILLNNPTMPNDPVKDLSTSYSLRYKHLNDVEIYYSISVGVASYPDDVGNNRELMVQAGAALLSAKRQGRKTIVRCGQDSEDTNTLAKLPAQEYELAVKEGRVTHHAQPILNPRNGQVFAFELLLRITPGEDGTYIRPDLAVEAAIRLGLTEDLTKRTLSAAHKMITELRASGVFHTKVSININEAQLLSATFLDVLDEVFCDDENAAHLIIEVLENDYLKSEKSSHTIHELKERRISIATDDLGKGFSSLERLFVLPTNIIKLDRCLIRHRIHAPELLAGIISALSSNGRIVIVEGIETEDDAEFIHLIGNVLVQGYYHSKPMPISDALLWATTGPRKQALKA